jgi:methyl-accepting chemotaxis protein
MDQVTQQNAALVEQAAAAAQSLQDQATNLAQVVSQFRLDGNQVVVPAAPKAIARTASIAPVVKRVPAATKPAAIARPSPAKSERASVAASEGDWEEF